MNCLHRAAPVPACASTAPVPAVLAQAGTGSRGFSPANSDYVKTLLDASDGLPASANRGVSHAQPGPPAGNATVADGGGTRSIMQAFEVLKTSKILDAVDGVNVQPTVGFLQTCSQNIELILLAMPNWHGWCGICDSPTAFDLRIVRL